MAIGSGLDWGGSEAVRTAAGAGELHGLSEVEVLASGFQLRAPGPGDSGEPLGLWFV